MVSQIDSTRDSHQDSSQPKSIDTHFSEASRLGKHRFDDLLVSLSSAHENRRARQVTEWERMRRSSFRITV